MSLADELLADLEEGDEAHEGEEDMEVPEEEPETAQQTQENIHKISSDQSIRKQAKLRDSEQLRDVMIQIEYFQENKGKRQVSGPVEADPEYQLIVEANNLTVEIDNEINIIHKYTRDIYNKRFPELDSLVPTPLEYLKTVQEIGNNIDKAKNNEVLQDFLTPAVIMVVSVTASTTQGVDLDEDEMGRVMEACKMSSDLLKYKASIVAYVESRMTFIAPNLSIIVGASTAAKIMGVAGGITNLSKMPACNILLLGSQKQTMIGLGTATLIPHTGLIYYSDLVQKTPQDLRKKAARLLSSKCALAARVDSFHEAKDGSVGDNLLTDVEGKLEKLQEPPPVKMVKPLAAPIDAPRKKRGGRRHRKMKERLGMTDMRRQANRMTFGEIEEDAYQDDLGLSLGSLGKSSSGRVRGPPVDSKTKVKISKTLQQKLSKQQAWGGSTTVKKQVSGTASSVAFTPLQGLEIVNPQAAEKRIEEANQKYFSTTAGFMKIRKDGAATGT